MLTHRVEGWSVTLPILGQRRRFIGYQDSAIGRAFFPTRKAARAYRAAHGGRLGLRGRIVRATLILRVGP